MAADDKKIIFSMVGVSKAFTPNKNVPVSYTHLGG